MATQFNITITVDDAVANQLLNACSNIEHAIGTPITLDTLISYATTTTAANMPTRIPEKHTAFEYNGNTYQLNELDKLNKMHLVLIGAMFGLYTIGELRNWNRQEIESYIAYQVNEEYWTFFRFANSVEKHAKQP